MKVIEVQSKPNLPVRVRPGGKQIPASPGSIVVQVTPRIERLLKSGQIQKVSKLKAKRGYPVAAEGPPTEALKTGNSKTEKEA